MASVAAVPLSKFDQQLKLCLDILHNAKTDTEKFAALLVVSKSIKAGECSTLGRKQILEAVGISFLIRLLQTESMPEGCSAFLFKSVAVNILSALLEDPLMACSHDVKKIVPHLCDVIKIDHRKTALEDRELLCEVQSEVYSILARVVCSPGGGQLLLDSGCVTSLTQPLCSHHQEESMMRALGILVLLTQQCGAAVWRGAAEAYCDLWDFLAHYLITHIDEDVFSACELMTYFVIAAPESKVLSKYKSLQPLMDKLFLLLQSRLGVAQRQCVLVLVNSLVLCLGVECLLPPVITHTKLLHLILRLTCVEVRMAVENSTVQQIQKMTDSLCTYYHGLEVMLTFLCGDYNTDDLPLDPCTFSQAHDALLHACNGVCFFLQQVEKQLLDILVTDPVVVASVRFVVAIMAQAFTEVKDNVVQVLPLLVTLCNEEVDQLQLAEGDGQSQARPTQGCRGVSGQQTDSSAAASTTGSASLGRGSCGANKVNNNTGHTHNPMDTTVMETEVTGVSQKTARDLSSHQGHRDRPSSGTDNLSSSLSWVGVLPKTNTCLPSPASLKTTTHSNPPASQKTTTCRSPSIPHNRPTPVLHYSSHSADHYSECGDHSVEHSGSAMEVEDTAENTLREEDPTVKGQDLTMREEDMLPTTLQGVLRLAFGLWQSALSVSHCVQVIRLLLPVCHLVVDDGKTRQVFVRLGGGGALVRFVLLRHYILLNTTGRALQEQLGEVCPVLKLLTDLVLARDRPDLTGEDHWTSLVELATSTAPQLEDRLYVYKAYLTTFGVAVIKVQVHHRGSAAETERWGVFLQTAVSFVCQALPGACPTDPGKSHILTRSWPDVKGVWVTCLQALKSLMGLFPELVEVLLRLNFIPTVGASLIQPQGSPMDRTSVPVVLDFVESLTQADHRVRAAWEQCSGAQLPR